uniref:Uncharacterized protein n=1 Tax=Micrurus lemniscatus lemniscatus TaxID=129467 RepID=A0A2D4HTL1_MICLE
MITWSSDNSSKRTFRIILYSADILLHVLCSRTVMEFMYISGKGSQAVKRMDFQMPLELGLVEMEFSRLKKMVLVYTHWANILWSTWNIATDSCTSLKNTTNLYMFGVHSGHSH